MANKKRIPHKFHPWINARKQFRLSDAHIQMARELGLSPKRFAKYADRENQPWKLPLTKFIEAQYLKQFGKERPDEVKSMEEIAADHVAKRAARKVANANKASESESSSAEASVPARTENGGETTANNETTTNSQATAQPTPTAQVTAPEAATDETEATQPNLKVNPWNKAAPTQPGSDNNPESDAQRNETEPDA